MNSQYEVNFYQFIAVTLLDITRCIYSNAIAWIFNCQNLYGLFTGLPNISNLQFVPTGGKGKGNGMKRDGKSGKWRGSN